MVYTETDSFKIGQLKGPFQSGINILNDMITDGDIVKIGIQARPDTLLKINGNNEVMIGTTGLYEQSDTYITSLSFVENTNSTTFIEYVIKCKKDA